MSHKLLNTELPVKQQKKFTLPSIEGKFGLAFYIGGKEIFIGVAVGQVQVEQVVRKRLVKARTGVRVFRFE